MDPRHRSRLQQYQQDILNDLDVSHIFDYIFSKNVLSDDVTENIFKLKGRSERAKYLLETILQYGNNKTFEVFVDSLAKNYKWLWEKLAVENNEEMVNNSFEDSLSKGDVPRPPDHHVRRRSVEQVVATKLKNLARHKFLVLHGMPKAGKTCVAISVLRNNPELITNNFNGVVFWLDFGTVKTEDEIVAQQSKLLRKASSVYMPNNSHMMNSSISMSSIGSNADSHSISNYDYTLGNIRDSLKAQFSEPHLKECLLVLDKVNERKCVEAFDIGCKILITTRDTEVVRDCDRQIVEIENSFKEQEALELFASCLDESVSKLPPQAKRLNEICKGSPFLITLIGAQLAENKERLKHDARQWKYYLNKLEKKDLFDLFSWRSHDNPMKTIEFCINSLDENILLLYKKLIVLPDNVKVSAKVLSKLWKKDVNVVESIMKKLRSKSLIIEYYDREQMNYIYEVDDLLMNYLKTSKKDYEEESKRLHYDFLKSYQYDNTENAPLEIENDGYIAYYVGYHILNTNNYHNCWGLFKKLFLDLKFLGNKVRLTGPDDVTMDLQKYEKYIASDALDIDLLHSIKAFLRTHGTDLYRYPSTDIIQSILQHESQGILYRKASTIAQENCSKNELYLEFLHEHDAEEIKHSTIDVKENITTVCFLGDYVLVGTNSGAIKFFHIPTNKLKKELQGTASPVRWIGVACVQSPPTVAALCYDGVIKLWHVDDIDLNESSSVIDEEPEENYNNNFTRNLVPTINPKLGAFVNCRWTNNEEYLITQTTKMIMLYHPNGDIYSVINTFERERELLCCVPCFNDRYVIVATCSNNDRNVELINLKTKERIIAFEETDTVIDILTVPDRNKIVTLKQKEILEREFRVNPNALNKFSGCRCKTVILSSDVRENLNFLSMAINKTGTLLFVSTDDSRVVVVDLKSYSRVFDLENRRGNVVAMAVSEMLMWDEFEPSSDVLLTGTDSTENSAKVWYLDASYISQKNSKVRLTTKFDVSFLSTSSPITPTSSTPNSGTESANNTPKRHQSFANHKEVKKILKNTLSLDRQTIKPLNLKGIYNNNDNTLQPLLAVVDDKNNIQVMRGRKVLTEIQDKSDEQITAVKISPCNHYIYYGLRSGIVKKFTLRTKDAVTILDVYSPVQYLNFVNSNLLMVAGKNRCLMAYRFNNEGDWEPEMLQAGNTHLGSQELLNDLQGVKKKNGQLDNISSSGSDSSVSSRDRLFPNGDNRELCTGGGLVECFWISGVGLITVENNAVIKLLDKELKLLRILNPRQHNVHITCAAFQKNVLVICDSNNKGFQTFELKTDYIIDLQLIQDYKLNNVIVSCDLTADGNILAMGLDSGKVVIQNVKSKRQICLLSHHKTKVQSCSFSPVSERMYRSSMLFSPTSNALSPTNDSTDEEVPLVLVTMASEIVWWNLSYIMRMRVNNRNLWSRGGLNALTPISSPSDMREVHTPNNTPEPKNFFFNDGIFNQHCWKAIWKGKTCKEGSKKKEILACIKLTGMNAKRLCHDERFSCFVTVDNPGHIHIMNVMRSNQT